MSVVRYRPVFDLGVFGELAGTHIDINYNQSAGSTQVNLGTDAVWDWWSTGVQSQPAMKTLFTADVALVRVTAQDITVGATGLVTSDIRTAVPGTHADADSLAPNAAIVYSWRTNVSSRRQRGRMFLPMPPQDQVDGQGNLSPTYRNSVGIVGRALAVELESAARLAIPNTSADHVIYSTRSAAGPAAVFNVSRYLVGDRVDSQRRRLGREQLYTEFT